MSARAIVSGALFREPVTKKSKSGNAYVLATVREGTGETARWWKAFIFAAAAIEDISRLADGDPVSLVGEIDAQIYTPAGGESRLSWSIRADAILSARPKPREATSKADKPRASPEKAAGAATPLREAIDDDLPF
jgi:hypothetical protein